MDVEETDDLYIVDRNLNGKFTLENINELSNHEKKMEETYMYFPKWKQLI